MIFLSIAAYSDPHIVDTVRSALERSANPLSIRVGVALSGDVHAGVVPSLQNFGTRIDFGPALPEGIGVARTRALSLWRGEQIIVQTDAHMRFAQHWDEMLEGLVLLASATSRRWVLSSWCPGWTEGLRAAPGRAEFSRLGRSGLPHLERRKITTGRVALERGSYLTPHLIASSARFVGDVPPEPRARGPGEAILLTARAHAMRYTILHPSQTIAAHHDIRTGARFRYHADPLEALDAEVWAEMNQQPFMGVTGRRM